MVIHAIPISGNVYQMFKMPRIKELILLIVYCAISNIVFWESINGQWQPVRCKAIFYITTAIFQIYLTISDKIGYSNDRHFQLSIISKFTIAFNLLFLSLILYNILPKGIYSFFYLDGFIFAISIMILISGIRHGTFKN